MSKYIHSQAILVSTGILNIDSDSCVVSRRTCKKFSVRGGNHHSLLTANCWDPLNLLQGITVSSQLSVSSSILHDQITYFNNTTSITEKSFNDALLITSLPQ